MTNAPLPGKVTPVGVLSLKVDVAITGVDKDNTVTFNSNTTTTWDDKPETLRVLLQDAAADPRAQPETWKPLLEATLAERPKS